MLFLQKIDVVARKRDLFRKKKVSWKVCLQATGNPVRQRNAYKIKVVTLKSAIKVA